MNKATTKERAKDKKQEPKNARPPSSKTYKKSDPLIKGHLTKPPVKKQNHDKEKPITQKQLSPVIQQKNTKDEQRRLRQMYIDLEDQCQKLKCENQSLRGCSTENAQLHQKNDYLQKQIAHLQSDSVDMLEYKRAISELKDQKNITAKLQKIIEKQTSQREPKQTYIQETEVKRLTEKVKHQQSRCHQLEQQHLKQEIIIVKLQTQVSTLNKQLNEAKQHILNQNSFTQHLKEQLQKIKITKHTTEVLDSKLADVTKELKQKSRQVYQLTTENEQLNNQFRQTHQKLRDVTNQKRKLEEKIVQMNEKERKIELQDISDEKMQRQKKVRDLTQQLKGYEALEVINQTLSKKVANLQTMLKETQNKEEESPKLKRVLEKIRQVKQSSTLQIESLKETIDTMDSDRNHLRYLLKHKEEELQEMHVDYHRKNEEQQRHINNLRRKIEELEMQLFKHTRDMQENGYHAK